MMKPLLALFLACVLSACASRPNESMQDPTQTKADVKAVDEFAKSLPKPPER
ncbi:MAG: hypothetical protein ABR611_00385 [Chthoniobacterales bacterium]